MEPAVQQQGPLPESATLQVLLRRSEIAARVAELAREIAAHCCGQPLVLVCVLNGAAVFAADLLRCLTGDNGLDCRLEFVSLASYGTSIHSSGSVHLRKDTNAELEARHVLVVEDILDTGNTLSWLVAHLQQRRPASLRTVVLLDKPARRQTAFAADYVGFTLPDEFVVGYGLDYAEKYRGLPDLCRLMLAER